MPIDCVHSISLKKDSGNGWCVCLMGSHNSAFYCWSFLKTKITLNCRLDDSEALWLNKSLMRLWRWILFQTPRQLNSWLYVRASGGADNNIDWKTIFMITFKIYYAVLIGVVTCLYCWLSWRRLSVAPTTTSLIPSVKVIKHSLPKAFVCIDSPVRTQLRFAHFSHFVPSPLSSTSKHAKLPAVRKKKSFERETSTRNIRVESKYFIKISEFRGKVDLNRAITNIPVIASTERMLSWRNNYRQRLNFSFFTHISINIIEQKNN